MTEWFAKVFDIGKLPTKIVTLYAVVSGLMLFGPPRVLTALRLLDARDKYGGAIGLSFLLSAALLLLNMVLWGIRGASKRWRVGRSRFELMRDASRMTPAEVRVLREFYIQQQDSITLPLEDPTVAGLIQKRFLEPVGSIGRHSFIGPLFPVRMRRELRESLTMEMIGLPDGEPTGEEVVRIRGERPAFLEYVFPDDDLRWRR